MKGVLVAIGMATLVVGCRGKLTATAELKGPGSASTHLAVTGKKLSLWADTAGKWTGGEHSHMDVAYEIDVVRGGAVAGHVSCSTGDSGGSVVCGTHTNFNGNHDADCEIALACQLPVLPAGDVELRVTGRQGANVTQVRKMSLNIREK